MIYLSHIIYLCAVSDPSFLLFSILRAGDKPFPYTTTAWSPPPSVSNTFGPSAPWTHHHRGGEWEAGQRAQRGGQADKSSSLLRHLYVIQYRDPLMFDHRCPGTVTACGLSWPSSVSTAASWPRHTLSQRHRCLKIRSTVPSNCGCDVKVSAHSSLPDSSHRRHHHLSWKAMACLKTAKTSTWGNVLEKGLLRLSLFFSFLHILIHVSFFPSVLWQEWSTRGRCHPLNGCYGALVADISSWTSEKWRTGWNTQKRWELGGKEGFGTTKCVFPVGVLSAFCCGCFSRGKWCSGQCSSSPTGEHRLDRKWRRFVIGERCFKVQSWNKS